MEIVEIWQNLEKKRNTDYDFPAHSKSNLWGWKIKIAFGVLVKGESAPLDK